MKCVSVKFKFNSVGHETVQAALTGRSFLEQVTLKCGSLGSTVIGQKIIFAQRRTLYCSDHKVGEGLYAQLGFFCSVNFGR